MDLAVIAAGDPVTILEDVVGKHPLFVMIFAAGFAEAGAEGQALQDRMRQIVRDSGVYLLGPNTTLNSFLPLRSDLPGKALALISHSGHQGRHIWQGQDIGIPMAYWAPTGNEVDLEFADFVKYFATQEQVGAICGYVEGFKNGPKLRRAAELALAAGVPLVVVKVGLSELGQSTAMSHTAHLAGSDAVADAVFGQLGIVRVHGIDELLYTSAFLARSAPPQADGVCVYGISGGTLAHLSDLLAAAGVSVPALAESTQAALREWIPGYLRVSNPVDSGGAPAATGGASPSSRPWSTTRPWASWSARSWPTPTSCPMPWSETWSRWRRRPRSRCAWFGARPRPTSRSTRRSWPPRRSSPSGPSANA